MPPALTETTLGVTMSSVSTSPMLSVPPAVRPASVSDSAAAALSPACTVMSGASLVPFTVRVRVVVLVSPSASVIV